MVYDIVTVNKTNKLCFGTRELNFELNSVVIDVDTAFERVIVYLYENIVNKKFSVQ